MGLQETTAVSSYRFISNHVMLRGTFSFSFSVVRRFLNNVSCLYLYRNNVFISHIFTDFSLVIMLFFHTPSHNLPPLHIILPSNFSIIV